MVVLGPVGRNFAAGMSGGIAYVWDAQGELLGNCNLGMVELEHVIEEEDVARLREVITKHLKLTGSALAEKILGRWDEAVPEFVKVMPPDYKRVLLERQAEKEKAEPRTQA